MGPRDDARAATPAVVVVLIAANLGVFVLELALSDAGAGISRTDRLLETWGLVPRDLLRGLAPESARPRVWWTPLTSMFLHAGLLHLLSNLLFLWVFGARLERGLGAARFALLYAGCGLAAAAAHVAASPASFLPAVGASGAVSGLLGAFSVLAPGARVEGRVTLPLVVRSPRVPGLWLVLVWFAVQLAAAAAGVGGGVAAWAHAGGFATGAALALPARAHRAAPRAL